MSIHPDTHIGYVHYTVRDLRTQMAFYRDILGFSVLSQCDDEAILGTPNRALLRMTQNPQARHPRGTTGLYHTAFLVPSRRDLAYLLQRCITTQTPIQGTSNHGSHLAIYLPDPEGNGIELAWDFPKEQWPPLGGLLDPNKIPRQGVDIEALLGEVEGDAVLWSGIPQGTTVGHIHLHVANLAETKWFYHDVLGLDITADGTQFGALFFSAGGYHHHIGTNIWRGENLPAPPHDALGLRYFTLALPDDEVLANVREKLQAEGIAEKEHEAGYVIRDPSQTGVLLTVQQKG